MHFYLKASIKSVFLKKKTKGAVFLHSHFLVSPRPQPLTKTIRHHNNLTVRSTLFLPMKELPVAKQPSNRLPSEHIDIPVQGIQMAGTDGTAQAVNALAQVYRVAAHYKAVAFIQVEHGFFEHKGRNFLKILKHGGFRMVTLRYTIIKKGCIFQQIHPLS